MIALRRGAAGLICATACAAPAPRLLSSESIQHCLANYSIEVTPAAAGKIACFKELPGLKPGTVVNVTFLPGSDVQDTIQVCHRLLQAKMSPVAHLPARSFESLEQVDRYLEQLSSAGVKEVLVLAGGAATPAGSLTDSLQILRSGLLQKHSIQRVGVAAHPEGHPDVEQSVLMGALLDKAEWAAENKMELYFATQFCFEPAPIIAWEKHVRTALQERLGPHSQLPGVHIGVAGPAKISALIKFGTMSGVGASLQFVSKYAGNVLRLASTAAPDELVAGLAEYQQGEPECILRKLHFYPFGGMKPTLHWANAVEAGEFEITGEHSFSVTSS